MGLIKPLNKDYVTPEMFGAIGDGVHDDTEAILTVLEKGKHVLFDSKTYVMSDRLVLNNHIIDGTSSGDTWGKGTKILFKNMPDVDSAVYVEFASEINNVFFKLDTWTDDTPEIDGLRVARKVIVNSCIFNNFTGNGVNLFTEGNKAPYYSNFTNCNFNFNKKHGIVIGVGCNCVNFINPQACWNGTTVYNQAPSTLGSYDGIYIDDGLESNVLMNNFSNVIVGGDFSFNSRYGIYYKRANMLTQIGGYAELNKSYDYNVECLYASSLLNLYSSNVNVNVNMGIYRAGSNIWNSTNRIIICGRDYGSGIKVADTGVFKYAKIAQPLLTRTGLLIRPEDNNIDICYFPTGSGKQKYNVNFSEDVTLNTNSLQSTGSDVAMYLPKNSTCGNIYKNWICGIDANKEITDKFDEAVTFVVRTTQPSLIANNNYAPEDIGSEKSVIPITLCGLVPVNISAPVGSYIIPIKNSNGSIGMTYKETPTFEEYLISIGKVIKQEETTSIVSIKVN